MEKAAASISGKCLFPSFLARGLLASFSSWQSRFIADEKKHILGFLVMDRDPKSSYT
jgi:hypothetical protein